MKSELIHQLSQDFDSARQTHEDVEGSKEVEEYKTSEPLILMME
jgi:hypothetical protein